jgi:RNA polymerase sigma-70 factor (ECF subfamily)
MNGLDQYNDNALFNMLSSDKKTAEAAFAELYLRHSSRIYAYCRRFLGNKDDAQDVFQETFVKFLECTKQPRVMTNVPAFLLKIARNLCVNVKRRERNPITFEDYMVSDDLNNNNDELLKLIKMAMDLLPVEYKDIFILREYDGLTYTEIAEVMNSSLSAVKIRLFRAKQKVREILSPYLADLNKYM